MDTLTHQLAFLNHCRGIGRRTVWQMIQANPRLCDLHKCTRAELRSIFHLSEAQIQLFMEDRSHIDLIRLLEAYQAEEISIIPFHHPNYPSLLKNIYDPPYLLYTKGNIALLNDKKILSVVGTRYPSVEAGKVLRGLIGPLISDGWTIISGMATGIDGMAHRLALHGRTIAVLGSGLWHPYPSQNRRLFQQLCEEQLVISEYPPSAPPERWRFPERNRIISGMALGTLVVEARERSGSLITADQALEQGREVFAVPGSILNVMSAGTNRLIQQGAKLVCDWQDIVQELNWA
ncbi:DNA-processing protein DprA [Sporolactobacillus sp. CPB3-1]|uniref:DNA-processing protein DprA n=1 Tax=Sporolactobacillus mangiferae TaxID=2940498 RepID=A0ABT0M7Q5_9BACL|nr:DNA-processing protein DprA [Sporolactobacillus mangiferae]MCL1630879.1 DNA-processing protein DprA [Sporolactobacillus mangiferae]